MKAVLAVLALAQLAATMLLASRVGELERQLSGVSALLAQQEADATVAADVAPERRRLSDAEVRCEQAPQQATRTAPTEEARQEEALSLIHERTASQAPWTFDDSVELGRLLSPSAGHDAQQVLATLAAAINRGEIDLDERDLGEILAVR